MTGPLALVTGASSGIGATFARALAARGYDLVLVARRRARLEALGRELEAAHGIHAEALAADLTTDAGIQPVEDRIATAESLDLLVNNAGFGTLGRFWEADLESQSKMHRLHVLATMRLCHAALKRMVPVNRGAIINVSSVAGFATSPGSVSYGATKAWMNRFTEGLYMELASAGSAVRIEALCPGFVYSEFHDVMGAERGVIPAWLWSRPEDVVAAALRGLKRGELFVVPGWPYKLLVGLLGVIPGFVFRPLALCYARRARREVRPASG